MPTRLVGLAVILALLALTGAAVTSLRSAPPQAAERTSDPRPSAPPSELVVADFLPTSSGPHFDNTAGLRGSPTESVAQSKLWYAEGAWWGVLLAEGTSEYRIHRFDWQRQIWIDTGPRVAARAAVRPDVLWTDAHLYIVTGGVDPDSRNGISLLRYTFDQSTERYHLDPDFPVRIANDRTRSLTLARDAGGRLWMAYIRAGNLWMNRSLDNDWIWDEPFVPELPGTHVDLDASALFAFEDGVAIIWSNQRDDAVYMALHDGGDGLEWTPHQVAVEGLRYADDHVNFAVLRGEEGDRLFVAVKTSLDTLPNPNRYDPQVLLLVREPEGTWRNHLVSRVQDRHTRPVVLLDEDNEMIYVFVTSPVGGGDIHYKVSSLDRISFAAGRGTPVIDSEANPLINSATSTKQNVGIDTGLLVLASDVSTGRYVHGAATLGGDPAAASRQLPDYDDEVPTRLMLDVFDPFVDGSEVANGWRIRSSGDATVTIATTEDGRRMARALAPADGSRVRFCKRFDAVYDGQLRVEADIAVSGHGRADASATSVRHGGMETVAVRLSRDGTFSYFDDEHLVSTGVRYQPDAWYTSSVTIHLAERTYDWEVRRLADDTAVLRVEGAAWRPSAADGASEVCLQTPTALDRAVELALARVLVER